MESTRKVLNFIFIVAVIIGSIWALVMFIGGGFPVSLSTVEARAKFDVSKMGWELLQPDNGVITITHEKPDIKEGWGALQFDYQFNSKKPPGITSTCYGFEGLRVLKFWAKAKYPCLIGVRLKDKHDQYNFQINFSVGTKWKLISCGSVDFKLAANMKERMEATRFGGYIDIRDVTPKPQHKENTLWIDDIWILR